MKEDANARLKRLTMRSWRRGMKEMDLILGPYADARLADMPIADITHYDSLLSENDQDLYSWITGAALPPEHFSALIAEIAAFARAHKVSAAG
jgi:antitoxin CptB